MEGWIKLYRKFTEWEWFTYSEMVHLFIYLLLNANREKGDWRGIIIERGQILTGLNSLHQHTKISYQKIRTCLKRLEKTKEINIQTTNKYSIITICNYESYQSIQQATNKQPNKQLTNNQQTTNNKQEVKEVKEVKEERTFLTFDFVNHEYRIPFEKWIEHKKARKEMYKSEVSLKACYNKLVNLSENDPAAANEIVNNSLANNWAGLFKLNGKLKISENGITEQDIKDFDNKRNRGTL